MWKDIYALPCKVTINGYLRPLQHQIRNNMLYLNKKTTYVWIIKHVTMFFLQNGRDNKSPILLLHSYTRYLESCSGLFHDSVHFSQLTLQTSIYGFHNIDNDTFLIQNHVPLLLKLHIYTTPGNTGFYLLIIF